MTKHIHESRAYLKSTWKRRYKEDEATYGSIAWKAMKYYGWLGSGLGTFHYAYLPFQNPSSQNWFYHAESLYAQCGVELGYTGLLIISFSVVFMLWGVQSNIPAENWRYALPAKLAGSYLVISQALHSFVDFALILPALFVPACVLLGSVQGVLANACKTSLDQERPRSIASHQG